MGWFEVGPAPEPASLSPVESMRRKVEDMLRESTEMVAIDNHNVTREQRAASIEYPPKTTGFTVTAKLS